MLRAFAEAAVAKDNKSSVAELQNEILLGVNDEGPCKSARLIKHLRSRSREALAYPVRWSGTGPGDTEAGAAQCDHLPLPRKVTVRG
jgi:hypothetical protein